MREGSVVLRRRNTRLLWERSSPEKRPSQNSESAPRAAKPGDCSLTPFRMRSREEEQGREEFSTRRRTRCDVSNCRRHERREKRGNRDVVLAGSRLRGQTPQEKDTRRGREGSVAVLASVHGLVTGLRILL